MPNYTFLALFEGFMLECLNFIGKDLLCIKNMGV